MKIKILLFLLGAGVILASCSDKEAEAKMKQMETDMHKADSICNANSMMKDSTMRVMQHQLDSLMMMESMRSSSTPSKPGKPTTGTTKATQITGNKKNNTDIHKKPGAN